MVLGSNLGNFIVSVIHMYIQAYSLGNLISEFDYVNILILMTREEILAKETFAI